MNCLVFEFRLYNFRSHKCSKNDVRNPNSLACSDLVTASNCFGSPAKTIFACILFSVVHKPSKRVRVHERENRTNQTIKNLQNHVPAIGISADVSNADAHSSIKTYEKCVGEIPALVKVPAVHNVQTNTRNLSKKSNDG